MLPEVFKGTVEEPGGRLWFSGLNEPQEPWRNPGADAAVLRHSCKLQMRAAGCRRVQCECDAAGKRMKDPVVIMWEDGEQLLLSESHRWKDYLWLPSVLLWRTVQD